MTAHDADILESLRTLANDTSLERMPSYEICAIAAYEIKRLRARVADLERERDELKAELLVVDAWPARDVVARLVDGANILIDQCERAGPKWEPLRLARDIARQWLSR